MQQRNKPYPGLFITLEGGEGVGKSLLAESLAKELHKMGYEVEKTREPGGVKLAEHLRELLLHSSYAICEKTELLLFLAARLQHLEEAIIPSLRASKIVLCERFNDSTIAYQGSARHLGMQYVEDLCKLACEGVEPDITLFLDLDPQIGLQRLVTSAKKSPDRMEKEELQFHREVRNGFLHLADKYPQRILTLDGEKSPEEVVKEALSYITPKLMLKPV